jgi:hypothetical protein
MVTYARRAATYVVANATCQSKDTFTGVSTINGSIEGVMLCPGARLGDSIEPARVDPAVRLTATSTQSNGMDSTMVRRGSLLAKGTRFGDPGSARGTRNFTSTRHPRSV